MRFDLEMPEVLSCDVGACAFNDNQKCHAKAITIGDKTNPGCDTFFATAGHTTNKQGAGVGACKVESCQNNKDYFCMRDSVRVRKVDGNIVCTEYAVK
jgi:hypothetical protein